MKEILSVLAWIINHWILWGCLFGATGALKLLQHLLNKGPSIIG